MTLNIGADQQMGPRLAARIDDAASAVFLRALDRLDDIARLARELDVSPAPTRRLVSALRVLAVELAGARCAAGAPAPFRPQAVALACGAAVEACDQLEAAVRPSVAVDAAAVARYVATLCYGDQLRNGRLTLGVAESHGRLAAVRSEDLAEAIQGALHLVFAGAHSAGPAQLIVSDSADAVTVEIAWSAQLTPAQGRVLIEPLRPLAAYGARAWCGSKFRRKAPFVYSRRLASPHVLQVHEQDVDTGEHFRRRAAGPAIETVDW